MQQNVRKIITITLLSVPLSAAAALVPVLSELGAVYPQWADWVQLLITLPSLFMMVSSLLTSRLSQRLSLRHVAVGSVGIILLAGISPYWIWGFPYLLATRAAMGIGLGLLNTTVASLPAIYFPAGKTRDTVTGVQAAFISAGGILFSLLSGMVAKVNWQAVFLVQLINLAPLLVAVFAMPQVSTATARPAATQKIFVREALPITLLSFVCIVMTCTYPLNLSMYVANSGLGDSGTVGILTSVNSLLGFGIGLVFGKILEKGKQLTLPTGLLIIGTGFFTVAFATNSAVLLLGSALFGIGSSLLSPALHARLYRAVPQEYLVAGVAMLGIGSNVSQFISPFLINPLAGALTSHHVEATRFLLAGSGVFLIAILLFWQSLGTRKIV